MLNTPVCWSRCLLRHLGVALLVGTVPSLAHASEGLAPFGVPLEFVLFAITLLGVALFHKYTLQVGLGGLFAVLVYKFAFTGFAHGEGFAGMGLHFAHEGVTLSNLFLLLMGFALLARHFEKTSVPAMLPNYLPDDWKGAFVLLVTVFVLSSFLDNIAAAMIGGAMAHQLFRSKVHIGYLAAIVAASNAGGSGSVVGDTTTTMMWINGVSPADVIHAYVAASVALVVCGIPAARLQQAYSPILRDARMDIRIDWPRCGIVVLILVAAISANVIANLSGSGVGSDWPVIGLAVWAAILLSTLVRRPDWEVLPETLKGTIFLLALVSSASLMPVEKLPLASWQTAFGLGFVSAIFDNIPLTALALKQGGYDWGVLAYAVGFGGSMIWFGSSAGVALTTQFPEARSVGQWLRHGWFVALAYVVGFFVMLAVLGWQPHAPHTVPATPGAATVSH
jgi:Na+/H+ antiporter NhaD/arsenite permease-like protein